MNKPTLIIPPPAEPHSEEVQKQKAREPINCLQCRHFDPVQNEKPQGFDGYCLRYPPTIQFIGMRPHPLSPTQMEPMTHQFVPQVSKMFVCGEFKPKDLQ